MSDFPKDQILRTTSLSVGKTIFQNQQPGGATMPLCTRCTRCTETKCRPTAHMCTVQKLPIFLYDAETKHMFFSCTRSERRVVLLMSVTGTWTQSPAFFKARPLVCQLPNVCSWSLSGQSSQLKPSTCLNSLRSAEPGII